MPIDRFTLEYDQADPGNYTNVVNSPTEGKGCDGNIYINWYEMHSSMDDYTYLVFNLDKKHKTFTGTFYWSSEHGRSAYFDEYDIEKLCVYNADNNELLYEVTLNCYSEMVSFSIDISGIEKLKIANYCGISNSFTGSTATAPCLSEFKVQY